MYAIYKIEIAELGVEFAADAPRGAKFLYMAPFPKPAKPAIFAVADMQELVTQYHFLCLPTGVPFMLPNGISLQQIEPLGLYIESTSSKLAIPGIQQNHLQEFHVFVVHHEIPASAEDFISEIERELQKHFGNDELQGGPTS